MLDIVERLSDNEMFVDAIDDAIVEIKRLRDALEEIYSNHACPHRQRARICRRTTAICEEALRIGVAHCKL